MASLLKLRTRPIARRILSVLVLVAVCLASLPIPVPVVAGVFKDLSIPFPCQDHPCGCRNAKQCWTTCGCMSLAEKLRWAESKGVTPPVYVDTDKEKKPACCASKEKACCSQGSSACRDRGGQCGHSTPVPDLPAVNAPDVPAYVVLLTSYIAKCGGNEPLIASLPWSILAEPMKLAFTARYAVWRWVTGDERLLSTLAAPPIPPPRLCATAVA